MMERILFFKWQLFENTSIVNVRTSQDRDVLTGTVEVNVS